MSVDFDDLPSDWVYDDECLKATFIFSDFKEAFGFMTKVAFEAEILGHHPDWSNSYNKVNVSLKTHDKGKVTELDVKLAKKISLIAK